MTGPEVPIVSSPEDFGRLVQDADILLFDKLASLNRLVQWGDNRPVGHCGVWFDGGVYEATRKDAWVSGVFHTPFDELLDLQVTDDRGGSVALVRTVTAMRHEHVSTEQRERIRLFLQERSSVEFAVHEMVLLTPFAVDRAHGDAAASLHDLVGAVIRVSKLYARRSLHGRGGTDRMFCSELVYRSFEQAGLLIDVLDPLVGRLPRGTGSDRRQPGRRRGEPEAESVEELLQDYVGFFEEQVRPVSGPDDAGPAEEPAGQRRSGAWDDDRRRLRPAAPRRPLELADMVTPGDLWSSPSLRPVAVLHRPPGR